MKKYEEINQVHWVSKKSVFHKESHTDNILPSKESRKGKRVWFQSDIHSQFGVHRSIRKQLGVADQKEKTASQRLLMPDGKMLLSWFPSS